MNDPIPEPLSGKSILPWAVPVTRALNAIGDKVGATARNERDRRAANKPLPYEVRWDSSLNSGEGGYKIYLPTEHLLSYAGEDVATSDISGATVIQANNIDTPWYSLDDIDTSADHVWLVVTVTESSGSIVSVDAEFAAEESQAATGENVVNICIAEVSYEEPENEGDPAVVTIKQSVVGALHLGGAGGGGGGGSVTLDDVSTDWNDDGEVQIKDWDTGTPASPTTIAQAINAGNMTAQGTVVERTAGGVLKYKKPGTLAQLLGSSVALSSQKILTGLSWDVTNHRLVISSANITVANGVITSWTANADENIETTAISSIIN